MNEYCIKHTDEPLDTKTLPVEGGPSVVLYFCNKCVDEEEYEFLYDEDKVYSTPRKKKERYNES